MRPPVRLNVCTYAFPTVQAYIHMNSESLKMCVCGGGGGVGGDQGVKEHVCVSGAASTLYSATVRHTGPFISNHFSLSPTLSHSLSLSRPSGVTMRTSLSLQGRESGGWRVQGPWGSGDDGSPGEVCVGMGQMETSPFQGGALC